MLLANEKELHLKCFTVLHLTWFKLMPVAETDETNRPLRKVCWSSSMTTIQKAGVSKNLGGNPELFVSPIVYVIINSFGGGFETSA